MNKELIIIKTGSTFSDTLEAYGDFDEWIRKGLGAGCDQVRTVDVEHGDYLPQAQTFRGVVIAGSHSMVTDNPPWMPAAAVWISELINGSVPLLGICFGHQLLAHAMRGEVGYHPCGKEVGTVSINLLPEGADDPLFSFLPQQFPAHVTHSQTVLRLPDGAIRLAGNSFESNHAFRLGKCAWGVQFHPEFDARVMESYVSNQAAELEQAGFDISAIRSTIREAPEAKSILKRFSKLALQGQTVK